MNRNASTVTQLFSGTLPAAGAEQALSFSVVGRDRVALWIDYTTDGASATGFPRLNVKWDPTNGLNANGVILDATGHVLEREFYDLPTPGALGATNRHVVELEVPPGCEAMVATLNEQGDVANPGDVLVRAANA